tara:strand:+ start:925 stop:1362 length:438 start_codon:yes stop_codon:yes gene_type:complete
MNLAIIEAHKALDIDEVPIGAIILKDNKIIGRGYNQTENLKDPTAHAEIIAITSAVNSLGDWRLKNCEIYVTKEPCPMCAGAIINARIKSVYFGAYDEKEGCCGSLYQICNDPRFRHRSAVSGGFLNYECEQLLKSFFKLKRNKE